MHKRMNTLGVAVVLAMFAATLGLGGFGSGPPSVRAATTIKVCGQVTLYVAATATAAGQITVGGDPFVIAAGADADPKVDAGADLCLRLTINTAGAVTDLVVVDADTAAHLKICGQVSAYVAATGSQTGRLTIGDRKLTIAAGVDLPAKVKLGADLCATFTLNAQGQVQGAEVRAHADSTIHLCGTVTAFAAATESSTGKLAIGNHRLTIAAGVEVPAKVTVGTDICADLTLNALGEIEEVDVDVNPEATPPPKPGSEATPTPVPTGTGPNEPTGPGNEACPNGAFSAGGDLSLTGALTADASLAERAGALVTTSAIPFAMFLLGMFTVGLVSRWRRPKPVISPASNEPEE